MAKKKKPTTPHELPAPGRKPAVTPAVTPKEPSFPEEDPGKMPAEEPGGPDPAEIPVPSKQHSV